MDSYIPILFHSNEDRLTRGECPICFAKLQIPQLSIFTFANYIHRTRQCNYHEGIAKSAYETMNESGAVLIWHYDDYHLACRDCNDRISAVTNRPIDTPTALETYNRCDLRFTCACFICGQAGAHIRQLLVEINGNTRARLFACTEAHLYELVGQMQNLRKQRCHGLCHHCNLIFVRPLPLQVEQDVDAMRTIINSVMPRVPRCKTEDVRFRVRNICTKPSSWIRPGSWTAWWYNYQELCVDEKVL